MSGKIIPQTYSPYPLVWLAVWFAAGIVLGYFFEVGFISPSIAVLLSAAACTVARRASSLFIPVLFICLGVISHETQSDSIAQSRIRQIYDEGRIASRDPVEVEGVLFGIPEPAYGGAFLLLRAEKLTFKNSTASVSGNVRLFVPVADDRAAGSFDRLQLRYGSRLKVYCRLEREEKFQNPGVASRVQLLDQKGIDATASVRSIYLIESLGSESDIQPLAWIYEQRQRLIVEFREHFSPQTAGVMIASLLGNQHFLDRHTSEVFRDGGTFHVLVISGLHITFIGGLTLWFVSYFLRSRVLQFVFAVGFLWAYTLAVGAEVPVVRASIMFTVLLFSRVIYRQASQLNALGLCVLSLLVWRPADLFSASFQLTVVSVAAIVSCSFPLIEKLRAIGSWMPSAETPLPPSVSKPLSRICEFLYWNNAAWTIEMSRHIWSANLFKSVLPKWLSSPGLRSWFSYVLEGLTISVIVQIWMLPLLVIYFHRISPVSVLLNLWVGVFLTLESFCSIFAILAGGVSEWLAAPLILLTEFLNALMMWLPSLLSANDLASYRLPAYSGTWKTVYILFAVAVVIAAAGMFRWNPFNAGVRRVGHVWMTGVGVVSIAMLGLVIAFHPYSAPAADGKLKIDFLDVGQGDSALVTFPDGTTMLVDGGGEMDYGDSDVGFEPDRRRIGEAVVSEFLWEKGYSHIDYLVATHADADHIQGLSDVARNFDIGSVLVGTIPEGDEDYSQLMRIADSRKTVVGSVRRGDTLSIGGAVVQILHPAENSPIASSNDSSIVMQISYGSRSILLTGDIERSSETELALNPGIDLRADVIKVPHHGSQTSSTVGFIDRVAADTAVISVGRTSRFGHPHPEVHARWRASGAEVYKTGDKGTVTIVTDGNELQIQTFVP